MGKINLVLLSEDIFYLNSLRSYIFKNYSEKFNIFCMSNESIFEIELEKIKSGIVLVSESLYTESLNSFKFDQIIILSEKEELGHRDGNKILNKYIAANLLCENIISIYSNKVNEFSEEESIKDIKTKVLSVFSPIGGAGTSSIASSIAIFLAKLGKQVLYINLERIKSTECFFENREYSDIAFEENDEIPFLATMQSGLRKDEKTGVYCFDYFEDKIKELTDLKKVLDYIADTKMFSEIIIDVDSNISVLKRGILKSYDKVLIPILNDRVACLKLKYYIEHYGIDGDLKFILNQYKKEKINEEIYEALGEVQISKVMFAKGLADGVYKNIYESVKFMSSISEIVDEVL